MKWEKEQLFGVKFHAVIVEQLEEAKYEEELYPCNLAVEIEEAKRIVKSGGID